MLTRSHIGQQSEKKLRVLIHNDEDRRLFEGWDWREIEQTGCQLRDQIHNKRAK
jgi:hypothetical protein